MVLDLFQKPCVLQTNDTTKNDVSIFMLKLTYIFLDEFSQPGQSVLVCSELNLSRSITVVIAYLMWKKHWTLEVYAGVLNRLLLLSTVPSLPRS